MPHKHLTYACNNALIVNHHFFVYTHKHTLWFVTQRCLCIQFESVHVYVLYERNREKQIFVCHCCYLCDSYHVLMSIIYVCMITGERTGTQHSNSEKETLDVPALSSESRSTIVWSLECELHRMPSILLSESMAGRNRRQSTSFIGLCNNTYTTIKRSLDHYYYYSLFSSVIVTTLVNCMDRLYNATMLTWLLIHGELVNNNTITSGQQLLSIVQSSMTIHHRSTKYVTFRAISPSPNTSLLYESYTI